MLSNNMSLVRTCREGEHRKASGDWRWGLVVVVVVVVVVVGLEMTETFQFGPMVSIAVPPLYTTLTECSYLVNQLLKLYLS